MEKPMLDIIEERLKEAFEERKVPINKQDDDIFPITVTYEVKPFVIRCKDCAHHFGKFCWCSELRCYMEDDDFCSKGVRKDV